MASAMYFGWGGRKRLIGNFQCCRWRAGLGYVLGAVCGLIFSITCIIPRRCSSHKGLIGWRGGASDSFRRLVQGAKARHFIIGSLEK